MINTVEEQPTNDNKHQQQMIKRIFQNNAGTFY